MAFKVTTTRPFKGRLLAKPKAQQGAILQCIKRLGDDPRHPGLRTKKIRTDPGMWEARVDRDNRVSWKYGAERGTIIVVSHCSHDEVLNRR